MIKTVILLVIANATLNLLSPTFWRGSRGTVLSVIKKRGYREGIFDETKLINYSKRGISFIEGALNSDAFAGYTFTRMLGKGGYGIVFEAQKDDQKVAVKFMFDNQDYDMCSKAYLAYSEISAIPNIKYVIKINNPMYFSVDQFNACTMMMESALPTTEPMFKDYDPSDLNSNTQKLVRFVLRLLDAFAVLNFKGKIYHGDIKPDNIMFVVLDNGEIEPRIIDFDFVFKKEYSGYNPGNIIYTITYRPPELRAIVKENSPKKEELVELQNYEYDDDFKEEAWALGASLESIVRTNLGFINPKIEEFGKMMEVIRSMIKNEVSERISTLAAFYRLSHILKDKRVII